MKVHLNHEMKEYSHMKIGGRAKELIEIEKKEDLIEVLKTRDNIFIIGNGTNTLIPNGDLPISFIKLTGLQKMEDLGDGRVYIEAGRDFFEVIDFLRETDNSGLEDLAGIPGSIGGLIYMNGGAYGTEIFDCIESVEIIDESLNIKSLKKEEIKVTYRNTEIQEKGWTVLSVVLKLKKGFNNERVEELIGKREARHPLTKPSLGSTFKNPTGHFAAKLIIAAGMQGEKVGGIQVSNVHPNFLVNDGTATYSDVIEMLALVKKKVKETSGVKLEEEIVIIKER